MGIGGYSCLWVISVPLRNPSPHTSVIPIKIFIDIYFGVVFLSQQGWVDICSYLTRHGVSWHQALKAPILFVMLPLWFLTTHKQCMLSLQSCVLMYRILYLFLLLQLLCFQLRDILLLESHEIRFFPQITQKYLSFWSRQIITSVNSLWSSNGTQSLQRRV